MIEMVEQIGDSRRYGRLSRRGRSAGSLPSNGLGDE
jgi:hypothetical protein